MRARIAQDPTSSSVYMREHMRLGKLHEDMGEYAEAFTAYDAAAGRYTDMYAGTKAFGMNLQLYEFVQKAAPHLEGQFSHIVLRLVRCDLEVVVARDESLEEEREEVARWAAGRGRDHDAVAALRKIADLHPDGLSALALTEALLRAGDVDGAIQRLAIASRLLVSVRHNSWMGDVPRDVLRLMFRRLVRIRFGALPDALVARVNAATMEQLDRWAQRLPLASGLGDLLGP